MMIHAACDGKNFPVCCGVVDKDLLLCIMRWE